MIGVGTFKITERARKYVNQVLSSERLSYGYFTQTFEKKFAAAHDCRFANMTNSGTSCLQLALGALKNRYGWADGDEVIVPAVTFIATSNIVLQNNMKVVFVDVDPIHYEIDPTKIEAAITPRTRCIIPVHLFGQPCDMDPILAIAKKHGLKIIEDSCETMFARYKGRSVGSLGDIGCFSTYVAHILTTGVGGLCTTNDPELAVRLRSMMNHGRDSIYISIDDDNNKSKEEMELIIQRRFKFIQMGYSFRVTEMEGALGLAEFEDHEAMISKRRENAAYLTQKLAHLKDYLQLPSIREGNDHSFMMYPIVLRDQPKRELVSFLEENGIETRDMLPLTNQPYYLEHLKVREDDFPVAKWINNNGFYIGCHQNLTFQELDYISDIMDAYFRSAATQKQKASLILMSKGTGKSAQMMYDMLPVLNFDQKIFVEASGDKSGSQFFKSKGFEVIETSGSKGEALKQAVDHATGEFLVVMGTDGADNPEDISRLLVQLKQGNDVAIASRFLPGGGRAELRPLSFRSLGNRFFSFLLSVLFNYNVSDSGTIFRGFRKSSYGKLGLHSHGESVMFELTARAVQAGMKVTECPTTERRAIESYRKRNRVLTGIGFLLVLLRILFTPSRKVATQKK